MGSGTTGAGTRRRHRDSGDTVLIVDRDYQGDTAWRADSYNDWWHERPHRSYPAWIAAQPELRADVLVGRRLALLNPGFRSFTPPF